MRVAIIDDGICLDSTQYMKALSFDMECVGGMVRKRESEVFADSHGTIVGEILQSFSRESQIGSIKIIHDTGRGCVRDLIAALQWCDQQGIAIVHMSIGTSVWQDFEMLEKAVRPLVGRIHMLAAESNSGQFSLPSALPGVWSESWLGLGFPKRRYCDQMESDHEVQCCIEKKDGDVWRIQSDIVFPPDLLKRYGDYIGYSNSYQAAAITGILIAEGILDEDQKVDGDTLCRIFKSYSLGSRINIFWKRGLENKNFCSEGLLAEIPVVWVCVPRVADRTVSEKNSIWNGVYALLREFHQEGYYVVGLSNLAEICERAGVFWSYSETIGRESILAALESFRCDLLLICSEDNPCEEADCLLKITDQEAVFYRQIEEKGDFIFHSETDKMEEWYLEGKKFVLSCFAD